MTFHRIIQRNHLDGKSDLTTLRSVLLLLPSNVPIKECENLAVKFRSRSLLRGLTCPQIIHLSHYDPVWGWGGGAKEDKRNGWGRGDGRRNKVPVRQVKGRAKPGGWGPRQNLERRVLAWPRGPPCSLLPPSRACLPARQRPPFRVSAARHPFRPPRGPRRLWPGPRPPLHTLHPTPLTVARALGRPYLKDVAAPPRSCVMTSPAMRRAGSVFSSLPYSGYFGWKLWGWVCWGYSRERG